MSNVILCQGAYATTPYYIADDCINLHTIEELCYYIYHKAYLLEDKIVSKALVEWISVELELPKLAAEISKVVGKPDALSKLVAILSNNIGLFPEDNWRALLQEIGRNNRLAVEERRKLAYIKYADGYFAIDAEGTVLELSILVCDSD